MKNPRNTEAVSEILGEVILLAIAVTSISIIYMQVLSIPGPTDTTNVTILGEIEKGSPVFELQRGESLGPDTKIFLTLAGYERREFLIRDITNQEWDIGERITLPVDDITGIRVEATIVDTKTNSIVFWARLQEGLAVRYQGGIWHFDEDIWRIGIPDEVKDSSGHDNHGIALNGANIINGTTEPQNVMHNNSGYFNGYLDTIKVKTSWTLNITTQITIEAWMKPQIPQFISDIVGISGTFGYTPYIIQVNDNIYVIVSEDFQKGGLLSTIEIDTEGIVSYHQNLTLGKSTGSNICQPKIVRMNEKTFLVSFIDNKYYINLQTVNISTDGSINYVNQLKFTEESDRNTPNRLSLQKITDNLCAVAYWTPNSGGILKTVQVSSTGKIIDTGKMIQYDPVASGNHSREPYLIHVTGDIYALAYRGPSYHGILKTFNITPNGNITYTGKMAEFDNISGYEPCLVQVSQNVFAVAYRNNLNYGIVKTFFISSNGSIVWTGKMEVFENITNCYNPCIIYGEYDMFIVAYSSDAVTPAGAKGYIITFELKQDGSIIPMPSSRKQFQVPEGVTCHYPVIIRISEDLYGISFTGPKAHTGYLITILIGPHGRGIYKGDSYELYANTTTVEGYINAFYVHYYNNSLGLNWHHFVITYDGLSICLYVDAIKVNETYYPYHRIDLTKAPLYFGRFYCGFIDEIAIYDKVLTQEQILNHFMHPGILEFAF
jgi:hypothetical protein